MRKSNYDLIAEKYILAQKEFYKTNPDSTRQILFKELPDVKGKKVLDIGCGGGEDSGKLAELGAEVVGIDISKAMVENAEKKYPKIKFQVASAENLPFKDEEFDVVYSRFALHYAEDIICEFKEIWRVLKKAGIATILVPHPCGDYEFKKGINYQVREIVSIPVYGNRLTVEYPTHMFAEYFSPFVLEHFDILSFVEALKEPAKMTETGFFVLKLRKR